MDNIKVEELQDGKFFALEITQEQFDNIFN